MNETATFTKAPVVLKIDRKGKATYRASLRRGGEQFLYKKAGIAEIACSVLDKRFALPRTSKRQTHYELSGYTTIDEVTGSGEQDIWQPFEQIYASAVKHERNSRDSSPSMTRTPSFQDFETAESPGTKHYYELVLEFHQGSVGDEVSNGLEAVKRGLVGIDCEVGTAHGVGPKRYSLNISSSRSLEDVSRIVGNSYEHLGMFEKPVHHTVNPR